MSEPVKAEAIVALVEETADEIADEVDGRKKEHIKAKVRGVLIRKLPKFVSIFRGSQATVEEPTGGLLIREEIRKVHEDVKVALDEVKRIVPVIETIKAMDAKIEDIRDSILELLKKMIEQEKKEERTPSELEAWS